MHLHVRVCTGKMIWSCLPPRWRLFFILHNVPTSPAWQTTEAIAARQAASLQDCQSKQEVNRGNKTGLCKRTDWKETFVILDGVCVHIVLVQYKRKCWPLYLLVRYLPSGHTDNEFTHFSLFVPVLTWKHADAQESEVTWWEDKRG